MTARFTCPSGDIAFVPLRGLCLSGAGTLRETLTVRPPGGMVIIHGVPTSSWEQGQS